jgi:hypothetical protein
MARISPRILELITRDSVEAKLSSIHEHVRNKGMEPVAVTGGHVYGLVKNDEGERIFRASVEDFFRGKGEVGEFEDVTEEYSLQESEAERDRKRTATAVVESVLNRDRVGAAQKVRELLHSA